jgi:hypothetical protein
LPSLGPGPAHTRGKRAHRHTHASVCARTHNVVKLRRERARRGHELARAHDEECTLSAGVCACAGVSTPSTPDLPIKVGGGLRQPLRLDTAIRELEKELSRQSLHHDTPLHKSVSSHPSEPQTPTPRSAHREGEGLEQHGMLMCA